MTLLVWVCVPMWFDLVAEDAKRSGKLPSSIGSLMAHVLVSSELDQATRSILDHSTMPLDHQQLSYKNP
jgi:hypothetical protein